MFDFRIPRRDWNNDMGKFIADVAKILEYLGGIETMIMGLQMNK